MEHLYIKPLQFSPVSYSVNTRQFPPVRNEKMELQDLTWIPENCVRIMVLSFLDELSGDTFEIGFLIVHTKSLFVRISDFSPQEIIQNSGQLNSIIMTQATEHRNMIVFKIMMFLIILLCSKYR